MASASLPVRPAIVGREPRHPKSSTVTATITYSWLMMDSMYLTIRVSYARNMSMALIWVLTVLTCRALAVTHSLLLPILISSVPILVGWVSATVLSLMMARAIGSMLRKPVSQRTILSRKIGHRMPLCSVMCAASVGLLRAGLW